MVKGMEIQEQPKQLEDCSVSNIGLAIYHSCDWLARHVLKKMVCLKSCLWAGIFSWNFCSALGTWVFSIAGALLAIPVGIRRKSLAPLVFFGTTGTMLDIIMGISACEREHAERQMKLMEVQNLNNDTTEAETQHQ